MSRFSLDLRRFSVARIENHMRGERGEIRFESRLAQVRTPDLPRRSEFIGVRHRSALSRDTESHQRKISR